MPSLNGIWYVAVPNTTTNNPVVYTITALELDAAPVVSQPLFIEESISSPTSGFSMYWTAVSGQNYTVEVSTNLTSWTALTNVVAQSNTANYTDSIPVNTQPARFFRLTTQ
jgi:hypothetical protein